MDTKLLPHNAATNVTNTNENHAIIYYAKQYCTK